MRFALRDRIDDLDLDGLLGLSGAISEATSDYCGIERDYGSGSLAARIDFFVRQGKRRR